MQRNSETPLELNYELHFIVYWNISGWKPVTGEMQEPQEGEKMMTCFILRSEQQNTLQRLR